MFVIYLLMWTAFVSYITWLILHTFFYDPQSQIKRHWKTIFECAAQIGRIGSGDYIDLMMTAPWRAKIDRTGKLINALLEYHYPNPAEDDDTWEYVEENKYSREMIKNL